LNVEYELTFAVKNCAQGLLSDTCSGICVCGLQGEEVFVSVDPLVGWSGNHQDGRHFVQSGVYIYQLTVVMPNTGTAELFEGMVTLIR